MAFGYYRPVTVDHTKVNTSAQANFPVVIAGTYAWAAGTASGGRSLNASGFDIRPFSDTALTAAYTYQLRNYNATTGAFNMVVLVPSLSAAVDTLIYIGIGNAALVTDGSSTGTWDANFKSVYTMGDGTTLTLTDSTSSAVTLTNNASVTSAAGLVGGMGAASFNGTTQSLSTASPTVTADPLTIEAMFNPTNQTSSGDVVGLTSSTTLTGNRSFLKRTNNGTFNPMRAMQSGATTTVNLDQTSSPGAYTASAWNYGAVTYANTSDTNVHPNGQAKSTDPTATGVGSAIDRFAVGARFANSLNNNFYGGLVGEVRVSNVVRADSWIKTTFANLIGIATFYTVGAEVPIVVPPVTTAGGTVQPFTVSRAQQLFKKVAWDAEAKHTQPMDGRATRYDLSQPTMAEQRRRIEATKQVRAREKATRETMLWIASVLPQIEDLSE